MRKVAKALRPVAAAGGAALIAALCTAAVELKEDEPPAQPPRRGAVSGTVAPAGKVAEVFAVSRVTGERYSPAEFDKKTGRFKFEKLPGDAAYDICIGTADGRRIEGIDLEFVDARLLRLAAVRRKQLGLPGEREHKFSADDAEELLALVRDLKDFMEIRRVLYLRAHGRRATMLVELMRTRSFHASKGQVVWRVELWYFEQKFGGWQRLANQERVLRRERTSPAKWRKIDVTYYPRLSAYVRPDGTSDPVEFEIPERSNPSRGRPADTKPELPTTPHILGVDAAAPGPATRPAPPGGEAEGSQGDGEPED